MQGKENVGTPKYLANIFARFISWHPQCRLFTAKGIIPPLMGRYAVLNHQVNHEISASSDRQDHFDLLLEFADVLVTWELSVWLPTETQSIRRLPDHRLVYLDYQGPISNNRGSVTRVDQGQFELTQGQHPGNDCQLVLLNNQCKLSLRIHKSDTDAENERWQLTQIGCEPHNEIHPVDN